MRKIEFRAIDRNERGAVLDLLAEWFDDRVFFARYFEHDPTFRDDLYFVAVDAGRIVSTLQVFRKQIRARGAVLQVAAVGNVFTAAEYRERGLAGRLLRDAVAAMEASDFDLSLLFATRLVFYGRLGWQSHVRHLVFLDPLAVSPAARRRRRARVAPFTHGETAQIMDLYDRYNEALDGTTVRDREYWEGQLRYAGNPGEDFLVARDNGKPIAYARGTRLYDFYTITEHGCLPGHEEDLADVVLTLHTEAAASLPGTLTQLSIVPAVTDRLRSDGVTLRTVEDMFWMWRVVAPQRLAAKLGLAAERIADEDFFFRLLPPGESVYWIADRF
jgi:predicted N-acetyltransferase YhbS